MRKTRALRTVAMSAVINLASHPQLLIKHERSNLTRPERPLTIPRTLLLSKFVHISIRYSNPGAFQG
ncbi:hypothetical protein ACWGLF_44430 [Streptomyces puniciscabiei]